MKRAVHILISALGVLAIAGYAQAQAKAKAGYGGKSWDPTAISCFSDHFGSTNQNCAAAHYWFTALDPDLLTNGLANPTIYVQAAGASNSIACQNWASDASLTITTSNWQWASVYGRTSTLTPGAVTVPDGGHLFSWCYLQQGSSLHTVTW